MNRITSADEPCPDLRAPRIEKLEPRKYQQFFLQGDVLMSKLWEITNGKEEKQ